MIHQSTKKYEEAGLVILAIAFDKIYDGKIRREYLKSFVDE
ncbi:MAG: hypothetical protein O6940_03760 [Ignavibacteria bacterium]|nr:hypothetical protein [Ignavibacteria bacterium]